MINIYFMWISSGDNANTLNTKLPDPEYYYALNKILCSDWLNTNLSLGDVWLVGSTYVRLVANSKRTSHSKRDQCQVSSSQCYAIRIQC